MYDQRNNLFKQEDNCKSVKIDVFSSNYIEYKSTRYKDKLY